MTTLGKYVDLSENYVDLLDSDEDLIENYCRPDKSLY